MILVFIGKAGWKTDLLQENIKKHKENGKRLFWFENISDIDLEQFYQKSKGVIVASKGEGYGLPVIEALARNKQVLARNIPVLKEVGSNNVVYFNDGSIEEYANQINSWLDNLHFEDMPFKSFSSWKDCTQQILIHIRVIKQNYDQSNQKGIT
jgi:glycosyltransferase involved in cell wall biosynthesis